MLSLDDASQYISHQHNSNHKNHSKREWKRKKNCSYAHQSLNNRCIINIKFQNNHEINLATQIQTKGNSKFSQAQKRVRFGLIDDLCCTLVRFDLSNAYKNCATHAFICFRIKAQRQNLTTLPQLPLVAATTIRIELEPHHLLWAKCCLWYQKLPSKSFDNFFSFDMNTTLFHWFAHTHTHDRSHFNRMNID